MKPKIAILGDSHTDNWLYVKQKSLLPEFILCISKASTASATGVMNKKSKSQSRKVFKKFIRKYYKANKKFDLAVIELGEVDCNCTFWLKLHDQGISLDEQVKVTVDRMTTFVDYYLSDTKVVFMGAILPVIETQKGTTRHGHIINESQQERTDLTNKFNAHLKSKVKYYFDINDMLVNPKTGLISPEYRNNIDHHLSHKTVAPLLIQRLKETHANIC